MSINRIRTIIDKEWAEVFKNRMVIFTIAFMPAMFTFLPLLILGVMGKGGGLPEGSMPSEVPPQFLAMCKGLSGAECMQIFLMNEFMLLFMMMPLIIPTAIAAYSIVGEKTTRSLEPLLATPITTVELLIGKALASAVPAIVVTWICFGIFVLLMPLVGATPGLIRFVLGPVWLLAVFIIGPLMAIAAVNLAVLVSSRVNDPRVAEQVSGVMVMPIVLLIFGQVAGIIILNQALMFTVIVVMILIDVGLTFLAASLFQRETILTRWK